MTQFTTHKQHTRNQSGTCDQGTYVNNNSDDSVFVAVKAAGTPVT